MLTRVAGWFPHPLALAVGAAALVGGAVWYLAGRLSHRERPHAMLEWDLSPAGRGFTLVVVGHL